MADNNTIIFNEVQKTGTFGSVVDILNINFNLAKEAILQMRGKSAYEIWKEQEGNENKTQEEFLASLKESGFKTKAAPTRPSTIATIDDKTIYAVPDNGGDTWSEYIYIGNMKEAYDATKWLLMATHNGSGLSGALADIADLKLRDEPIVFTKSKDMNKVFKTMFIDTFNYNGETAIDNNNVYCSYNATSMVLDFYRQASGGSSFLSITLDESVLCKTLTNGLYYYLEVNVNTLPEENISRFKLTPSAFSPAYDPRNLNVGFTTNPVLNKYIKQIFVEVPENYQQEVANLCIFEISNVMSNGQYVQNINIAAFGASNSTFYYYNRTGESSQLDIDGYGSYSDLKLHIDIDWIGLRGKTYGSRRDYLTQKAYDGSFFVRQTVVSNEVGEDTGKAISQAWAKGIAATVSNIQEALPENDRFVGEFVDGYYSTSNKQTIGENGQTTISGNGSFKCFMLELTDSIVKVTFNVETAGLSAAPFYFLDADNKLLYIRDKNFRVGEMTILKSEFPEGAKFLYLNDYLNYQGNPTVEWESVVDVKGVMEKVEDLDEMVGTVLKKTSLFTAGRYFKLGGLTEGDYFDGETYLSGAYECTRILVDSIIDRYVFKCKGLDNQYATVYPYAIVDENGVILEINTSSNTVVEKVFTKDTIPAGAKYIYINNWNSYTSRTASTESYAYNEMYEFFSRLSQEYIPPFLYGKKVLMLGDSMIELKQDGKGIVEYFAEYTKAEVIRGGIGGAHLSRRMAASTTVNGEAQARANTDVPTIVDALCGSGADKWAYVEAGVEYEKTSLTPSDDNTEILENLKSVNMSEIDIITIFAGTNDWPSTSTVIGNADDTTDVKNINGAINHIVQTIHSAYPHIAIYFFTPIVRATSRTAGVIDPSSFSDVFSYPKGNSNVYLYDIANAIMEGAQHNHVPCCDLYYGMGWNVYNFDNFLAETGTDGTHPRRGFDAIAYKMAMFILSSTTHQDVSGKENRMQIVVPNSLAFSAEIGKYYRITQNGAITVTLPTVVSDYIENIILFFTASADDCLFFNTQDTVIYADGYKINAGDICEVNAIFNGDIWVVTVVKFS